MREAQYDPERVRRFYDDFGEREWDRLDADPRARVLFHVHRWYLQQFVKPGDYVLDAGAGPGRFTIELARLGARVTVGDSSPAQLDLNRAKVAEGGLEAQIEGRVLLDVVDCAQFADERFDAVVCYGSPLCYVGARVDDAIGELVRVTRRGGHLLLSVASRTNMHLPWLMEAVRKHGIEGVQRYFETGDIDGDPMHCFRWSEFRALLERQRVEIVAASASNFMATIERIPLLEEIERDQELWDAFLRWELEACRQAGAIEAGSHIIAVARRP